MMDGGFNGKVPFPEEKRQRHPGTKILTVQSARYAPVNMHFITMLPSREPLTIIYCSPETHIFSQKKAVVGRTLLWKLLVFGFQKQQKIEIERKSDTNYMEW